jgi:hypothetical protein
MPVMAGMSVNRICCLRLKDMTLGELVASITADER